MRWFKDSWGLTPLGMVTVIVGGMAVVLVIVLGAVALTAGPGSAHTCGGTITKLYTTYTQPDGAIVVGGTKYGGGTAIPYGGGTGYRAAVRKADGTYCERTYKKSQWLGLNVGDKAVVVG